MAPTSRLESGKTLPSPGDAPAYPSAGVIERLLDLVFPPTCSGCRHIGRWICKDCWHNVTWVLHRTCERCGFPSATTICLRCANQSDALDALVAVTTFQEISRHVVHALKYHDRFAISGFMGRLMSEAAAAYTCDIVTHVPLHPRRRKERGYDQALMLSSVVARRLQVPHRTVLHRVRQTKQQATLNRDARRENVSGAFRVCKEITGQRVLLIDDVFTTGATLNAAATPLKAAGARSVVGLVFAHAEGQLDLDTL